MTLDTLFREEAYPDLEKYIKDIGVLGVISILCPQSTEWRGYFLRDLSFALGFKSTVEGDYKFHSGRTPIATNQLVKTLRVAGCDIISSEQYCNMLYPVAQRMVEAPEVDDYGWLMTYKNNTIHNAILLVTTAYRRLETSKNNFRFNHNCIILEGRVFDFYGRELK